jgi:hypothetical protein
MDEAVNWATAHRRAYAYAELCATIALWQAALNYITVVPSWDAGPKRFGIAAQWFRDTLLWADPLVTEIAPPGDI